MVLLVLKRFFSSELLRFTMPGVWPHSGRPSRWVFDSNVSKFALEVCREVFLLFIGVYQRLCKMWGEIGAILEI